MENQKTKIISIVALVALALTLITATYAYFQAQTGEGSQTDIKINANTVDTLTFASGKPISITLDKDNFASGKGNQTGTTFASAMLTANNKTNTATMYYNLYLSIYQNNSEYTLNEAKPEIILTITDDDGNVIRNIENLSFKTVVDAQGNSIAGFDVTKLKGIITIFNKKEITASSQRTDKWNFNITFVNYDEDQSANAGKNFGAKIIISKDEYNPTLADYCDEGENLSNCIVKFGNLGYDTSKIYIHDENLENGAGDNSYRYAGSGAHDDLYSCKYNGNDVYNKYMEKGLANKGGCSIIFHIPNSEYYFDNSIFIDEQSVSWDATNSKCMTANGEEVSDNFASTSNTVDESSCQGTAIKNNVTYGYALGLEKLGAGEETFSEPAYAGISNYVCFGSNEKNCPEDNLYQIIGVFDNRVKLIKSEFAGSDLLGTDGDYKVGNFYYWNYNSSESGKTNIWKYSLLNKVNLNTNYLNNIGSDWASKIETFTWKLGAVGWYTFLNGNLTFKDFYDKDFKNNLGDYTAKIGLMLASDYAFATTQENWGNLIKKTVFTRQNNWIFPGGWTLTEESDYSEKVFTAGSSVDVDDVSWGNANSVKPVFHLISSVTYVSGTGSANDPFRIK